MIAAFGPFLSLRYLLARRISLLAILGVMFATWATVLVDSVFTGFVSQIRRDVRNSAVDLLVTDLPLDTSYEALRAALRDQAVLATAPRLRQYGLLQPVRPPRASARAAATAEIDFDHTANGFALLLGIDPDAELATSGLRAWIERGPDELARRYPGDFWRSPVLDEPDAERRAFLRLPDADEWRARRRAELPADPQVAMHRSSWPGVLFGWQRVRRTGWYPQAEPFDVLCASFPGGDRPAALHTHSLRVAFAGAFATGHRSFDEATVLLPIETLRTLLGHDASDPQAVDLVTDVAVRLRDGLTADAIDRAKERLRRAVQASLPAGSAPCLVLDWREQNAVFLSAVEHEQGMMQFVLFVVMLVAAFVIYATLHMMVVQKIKDIGILAAVGGSPRSIGAVFLLGGLAVGVVGTALGVLAGVFSARYLNDANDWLYATCGVELFPRSLFDLRAVPCDLQPSWVAAVAAGAIALSVLVAAVPARKAARLDPVAALAHE